MSVKNKSQLPSPVMNAASFWAICVTLRVGLVLVLHSHVLEGFGAGFDGHARELARGQRGCGVERLVPAAE